jgi:lysozyme
MILKSQEHIKKWEVFANKKTGKRDPVLKAYMPTKNDVPTIGWGHTKGVKMGDVITPAQAQILFNEDTAWAVAAVNKNVKVGLTQNQFDALVSFVFNVGTGNFKSSTLLRKLNIGKYEEASEQFLRWNKQKNKTTGKFEVLKGLTRRRADEMHLFLSVEDTVSEEINVKPANVASLPPMIKSKEMLAGVGALVTGAGSILGKVGGASQIILSTGLTIALLTFGAYILYNRYKARKLVER